MILRDVHAAHDATFVRRGGRDVVLDYGRADRAHRAVRNVVGVIEMSYDILVVTGADRVEFVDNAISNNVPQEDGQGIYALLLTPQGRIRTDMYIYNAGERLLVFVPPGEGQSLATDWREKTFIQDVTIKPKTQDFGVFGVHGGKATEKIASVFSEQTPDSHLTFVRGSMGGTGVTVIRTDGLTGEEGYEVICAATESEEIFDTLENRGLNAAPFGYQTWETLTLEAGTPLFETELDGELPNNFGLTNAVSYEKGCFVGQEVVSRVHNRGQPNKRLVGLDLDTIPEAGAAVFAGDETIGAVTRGIDSPSRETPIAMALVDYSADPTDLDRPISVRIDGTDVDASIIGLPFIDGSDQSARLPSYT